LSSGGRSSCKLEGVLTFFQSLVGKGSGGLRARSVAEVVTTMAEVPNRRMEASGSDRWRRFQRDKLGPPALEAKAITRRLGAGGGGHCETKDEIGRRRRRSRRRQVMGRRRPRGNGPLREGGAQEDA
jgi:hypothetical protein